MIWAFPEIGVPPKNSTSIGFPIISHPAMGVPHLWTPPIFTMMYQLSIRFQEDSVVWVIDRKNFKAQKGPPPGPGEWRSNLSGQHIVVSWKKGTQKWMVYTGKTFFFYHRWLGVPPFQETSIHQLLWRKTWVWCHHELQTMNMLKSMFVDRID